MNTTRVVLLALLLALGTVAFAAPVAPQAAAQHSPCQKDYPGYCEISQLVCAIKYGWLHCYPI